MAKPLPCKGYYSIDELARAWNDKTEVLQHWIVRGYLNAVVWFPLMVVFEVVQSDPMPCPWEGFAKLSRHHCTRLFRKGSLTMRHFICEESGTDYALPDTADDLIITEADICILHQERVRFESEYQLAGRTDKKVIATSRPTNNFDPTFRVVMVNGQKVRMGVLQARVLELLYQADLNDEPWQNGKRLLQQAGSESYTLANLFKRKPEWRELVESNGLGEYRIRKIVGN